MWSEVNATHPAAPIHKHFLLRRHHSHTSLSIEENIHTNTPSDQKLHV